MQGVDPAPGARPRRFPELRTTAVLEAALEALAAGAQAERAKDLLRRAATDLNVAANPACFHQVARGWRRSQDGTVPQAVP